MEKLLPLEKSMAEIIVKFDKKDSDYPYEIVSKVKGAKEMLSSFIDRVYKDQDIDQIKAMDNQNFHGYTPVDAEKIYNCVNKFHETTTVLQDNDGEFTTVAYFDKASKAFETFNNGFKQLTEAQMKEHFETPVKAVNEVDELSKQLYEKMESAVVPGFQINFFQEPIRSAIEKADKNKLKTTTSAKQFVAKSYAKPTMDDFYRKLPGELTPSQQHFDTDTIQKFESIWKQFFLHKVYDILMQLKTNYHLIDDLKKANFGAYDSVKTGPIIQMIAFHYVFDQMYMDLTKVIKPWYDELVTKIKSKKPFTKEWMNEKLDKNANGIIDLYRTDKINADALMDRIEKAILAFLNHLNKAVTSVSSTELRDARREYSDIIKNLSEIQKLVAEKKNATFK